MRRSALRPILAALTTVAVALAGGCASVSAGHAVKDPRTDPNAVSLALLSPGNFPTKPRPPLGLAGPEGNLVEARRLSEFTVLPFQVDPALIKRSGFSNGVIKDAASVQKAFPDPIAQGANHNFVSGFTALADNPGVQQKSIQNAVLRFATPEDAAAAAADMASKSSSVTSLFDNKPRPTQPIGLPRHPDTKAFTWPGSLPETKAALLLAYTVRGPFVVGQLTISNEGADAAGELAAATLDQQLPMLDRFQPTPVDRLAALPLDPDGLLARTLEPPAEDRKVSNGVYGPQGALAFSDDPVGDQRLYAEAGVSVAAISGPTTTYLAQDEAGAKLIINGFAETMRARGSYHRLQFPVCRTPNALSTNPIRSQSSRPRSTVWPRRAMSRSQCSAARRSLLTSRSPPSI